MGVGSVDGGIMWVGGGCVRWGGMGGGVGGGGWRC